MKVNTKVRYGIRAMVEIAVNTENMGVYQKDIAKTQQISEKYLDPIILALKNAGLITNFKGKKSGYVLCKPSSQINLQMIFEAFEALSGVVECSISKDVCEKSNSCVTRDVWCGLNNVINSYLKSFTLADLVYKYHITNKDVKDPMMFVI